MNHCTNLHVRICWMKIQKHVQKNNEFKKGEKGKKKNLTMQDAELPLRSSIFSPDLMRESSLLIHISSERLSKIDDQSLGKVHLESNQMK